jgi:hypothetical protein
MKYYVNVYEYAGLDIKKIAHAATAPSTVNVGKDEKTRDERCS